MADLDEHKMEQAVTRIINAIVGSRGGASVYAQTARGFGRQLGMALPPYMTGNPMLQTLLGGVMGPMGGNVVSSLFPGMSGGLNVRDSLMRQMMSDARNTVMKDARISANAGIASAKAQGAVTPFYNLAAQMSGARQISAGMGLEQFGYLTTPLGESGDVNSNMLLSDRQYRRNNRIKSRLIGEHSIYKQIAHDYMVNPAEFGSMGGREVGMLAGDIASRGLAGDFGSKRGPDDTKELMERVKKSARSIESVRDIIKGPLREVVAAMEQTFGSGFLNTMGAGGAAAMVNKMRAVGQMGGFSTQQIMALAPSAKALIQQVGGESASAGAASNMTGLIMGLTRSKDKQFTNDGEVTRKVMRTVVGAQESVMSKNIASARSLIKDQAGKDLFDENINRISQTREVTMDDLLKYSNVSRGAIVRNRNTELTRKEMLNSHTGRNAALMAKRNAYKNRKREAIVDAMGGEGAYRKLLEANGIKTKEDEDEFLFSSIDKWKGMSAENMAAVGGNLQGLSKRFGMKNNTEGNLVFGNLPEAREREGIVRKMATLYEGTSYGGDLGTNAVRAFNTKDLKLKDVLGKIFNTKDSHFNDIIKNSGLDQEGAEKLVEGMRDDLKGLGMSDKEKADFINKHFMDRLMSRKGRGYSKKYKEDLKVEKDDKLYYDLKGDNIKKAQKIQEDLILTEKRKKYGDDYKLDIVDKTKALREAQKDVVEKKIDTVMSGLDKGSSKYKELKKIKKELSDADPGDVDNILRKKKEDLKGVVTDRDIRTFDKSEVTPMTEVIAVVLHALPALVKGVTSIAKRIEELFTKPKTGFSWGDIIHGLLLKL